eukprot:14141326-Alexandrium_andersonii.AAC.1
MYGQHEHACIPHAHSVEGCMPSEPNVYTDGSVKDPRHPERAVSGSALFSVGVQGGRPELQQ